tara:strand:- start:88 stop:228 length:141 start_codon:yes stop_codon:yes gene_type:complete
MELITKKKLDCKKIKSIEDVKLILNAMNLYIANTCEDYDKLKHLFK